jgi:hypothetical protein
VKCFHHRQALIWRKQFLEPGLHFLGSLACECDCNDLVRSHMSRIDDVKDACTQSSCFPASWSSLNQTRLLCVLSTINARFKVQKICIAFLSPHPPKKCFVNRPFEQRRVGARPAIPCLSSVVLAHFQNKCIKEKHSLQIHQYQYNTFNRTKASLIPVSHKKVSTHSLAEI